MKKIVKIRTDKDKLIEELIDAKNKLYMKYKKVEKDLTIAKNQISFLKKRNAAITKKYREVLNEMYSNEVD